MNKSAGQIGERIRSLRIEAGMTQSELAEGIVTRNMLSMIESARTLPSVDTLVEMCRRLGVPPGYVFAGQREEVLYKKSAVIERIRQHFAEGEYESVPELSDGLTDDAEIASLCTLAHINIGKEQYRTTPQKAITDHFVPASALAKDGILADYAKNTERFARLLLDSTAERITPASLCDKTSFLPFAFDPDIFPYLVSLRCIETGAADKAAAIENSGLIQTLQYRCHIAGAILDRSGESAEALPMLIKAAEEKPNEVYSLLRIYTDIELCAQKLGEYEKAYKYSAKHIALIENMK